MQFHLLNGIGWDSYENSPGFTSLHQPLQERVDFPGLRRQQCQDWALFFILEKTVRSMVSLQKNVL
jgi:hypothetical protein